MTTTPMPKDREMMEALKERIEVRDDYARRLEEAVRTWESLDSSPQTLLDLNDTVVSDDAPATVPWPTRPIPPAEPMADVLNALPDAIVLLDGAGCVKIWNLAAEQLFGWRADEVAGKLPPFLSGGHVAEHTDILAATRRDSPIRERIVSRRCRDGKARTLSLFANATPTGDIALVFKPYEPAKAPTVADTTTPPSQKLVAMGRMVAAVSHDFNNVLSAIGGSGDLLADRIPIHSPDREWVEVIRSAARHATGLTRRLMNFSRPAVAKPRETDLSELVQDIVPLVKALVPNGVRLKIHAEPNLPATAVDPTAIEQVILNLATNAGQAMPRGGALQLRTSSQMHDGKSYLVLAVADSGTGMDEATRRRVFEPYFTTKGNGTGLGLATVRDLVAQAQGFIEVDSHPELGSVFRVFFPALPPGDRVLDGEGRTALVVDDDVTVRNLIKSVLEATGFNVTLAASGDEALHAATWSRGGIDLLIADIVMPGLGGRRLAAKLREQRPELAVIFVSAYPQVEEELPAGMTFLAKPFMARQLLNAVRGTLMMNA